jgi:hypothetical protein
MKRLSLRGLLVKEINRNQKKYDPFRKQHNIDEERQTAPGGHFPNHYRCSWLSVISNADER